MTDNFSEMDRATLEEHARAYANGMHELAGEVMKERFRKQQRSHIREVFNMLWGTDYKRNVEKCCCDECEGQWRGYGKR